MKIEQANNVFGHKIVGGSEYGWSCWPNARWMDYESEHAHGSVVYSTSNGMIFEATVNWKDEHREGGPYRWLNPAWANRMVDEAQSRGFDHTVAWDDVHWIDLEVWADFAEKTAAMFRGDDVDTRIQVPIDLSDEEFSRLAMEAHRQDITLNQLVVNILQDAIEAHRDLNGEADDGMIADFGVDADEPFDLEAVNAELADAVADMREIRDEFRELCLKPHEPAADDTSTSDIEHSAFYYDYDRNR